MPPRKKKDEKLIHLDIETISKTVPPTANVIHKKLEEGNDEFSLGETLKKARDSKHKTIEECAKKIYVKPIFLEALEEGKYFAFPGLAYGIGFLKLYANYLGLNADDMIEKFKKETNTLKEDSSEPFEIDVPSASPTNKIILISFFLIIFLFVILYGFFHLVYNKEHPFSSQTGASLEVSESFNEETNKELPSSDLENESILSEITTEANFSSTDTPTDKSIPLLEQKIAPSTPTVYGLKIPERISIQAIEEVWIEVQDENKKTVFGRILYPKDIYNPPLRSGKLSLNTGNAGALAIFIDKNPPKPLGAIGSIRQGVVLDPAVLSEGLIK